YSLSGTTDLWRVSVHEHSSFLPDFLRILSEEEIGRANRYRQQEDGTRFIVGKGMLRMILSRYLDCIPSEIVFKTSFKNKPGINPSAGLQFNVSYSKNWIIVAVATEPVGVDIEFMDKGFDYSLIMDNWFT